MRKPASHALLVRALGYGAVAGAGIGATFLFVLAILNTLVGMAPEAELVALVVLIAALVGGLAGACLGLTAGLLSVLLGAHHNLTMFRGVVMGVGSVGAATVVFIVYGVLTTSDSLGALMAGASVVAAVAAAVGWVLAPIVMGSSGAGRPRTGG